MGVVEFRQEPVRSIKKRIQEAAARAGLDGGTPHALKHTGVTSACMAGGAESEDLAEYFATSAETIRRRYRHARPLHQVHARAAVKRNGKA